MLCVLAAVGVAVGQRYGKLSWQLSACQCQCLRVDSWVTWCHSSQRLHRARQWDSSQRPSAYQSSFSLPSSYRNPRLVRLSSVPNWACCFAMCLSANSAAFVSVTLCGQLVVENSRRPWNFASAWNTSSVGHRLTQNNVKLLGCKFLVVVACIQCVDAAACHRCRKNGWTDRDAVWKTDSCGFKESCIRWGPDHTTNRGTFWGRRTCAGLLLRILRMSAFRIVRMPPLANVPARARGVNECNRRREKRVMRSLAKLLWTFVGVAVCILSWMQGTRRLVYSQAKD